jgi:DNA polymerase I-like protein with 3'-5' exonuclease and polymerase domains
LADQIEDTKDEAKKLIDGFKAGLTGYLGWEQSVHKALLAHGYVETVLGRKRRFGETLAEAYADPLWKKRRWHWKVEKCKRQSTNVIIQGSSADQVKKALIDLNYPKDESGNPILDHDEWGDRKSLLEEIDVNVLLQVHDELVFDAPLDVAWEDLQRIASTMANTIPNDAGITFKSDIEASPYWGGKFSPEQIAGISAGTYDWTKDFEKAVSKKLGIEYEMGTFAEADKDEDSDDGDEEEAA